MSQEKGKNCSFCGKRHDEVSRLIAGPKVNICDECILLCNGLLGKDEPVSGEGGEEKGGGVQKNTSFFF